MDNERISSFRSILVIAILYMVSLAVFSFPAPVNAAEKEPYITTIDATSITKDSATLSGAVDGNTYATTAWFEYGTNLNLGQSTTQKDRGREYDEYTASISKLYTDTIYYFRAVARNSHGTVYGEILSFRTNPYDTYQNTNYYYNNPQNASYYYAEPAISIVLTTFTAPATAISDNSTQLNSLIFDSGNNFINSWFEWGTTADLGNKTITMPVGALPSVKHANILSGLMPGTTYYFRAVAENYYSRSNGSILSFTTSGNKINQNVSTTTTIKEPIIIKKSPAPKSVIKITTTKENTNVKKSSGTSSYLGASVLGSNSFLPNSIIGWLILVILLLILLLEVRHLYGEPTK